VVDEGAGAQDVFATTGGFSGYPIFTEDVGGAAFDFTLTFCVCGLPAWPRHRPRPGPVAGRIPTR
jgi:hypothetical protein